MIVHNSRRNSNLSTQMLKTLDCKGSHLMPSKYLVPQMLIRIFKASITQIVKLFSPIPHMLSELHIQIQIHTLVSCLRKLSRGIDKLALLLKYSEVVLLGTLLECTIIQTHKLPQGAVSQKLPIFSPKVLYFGCSTF